jgi:hypothetical protein
MEAENGDEVENLVQKFKEELGSEQENLIKENRHPIHSIREISCEIVDQISSNK